jgi:Uma2 family endonuclease
MATATVSDTRTFAELHARLGGVPLERIRTQPPPGTATEADVLEARDGATKRLLELIDGVLVEKPVGTPEALLGGRLFRLIADFADEHELGVTLPGDGPLRLSDESVRYPDVSFIPWDALPEGEIPDEQIWSVAPALAVEVLSPSNTDAEMARKLKELFTAGCQLVWLIDPQSETAKVYTSAKRSKQLDAAGTLDGGRVLPGFKLALADLFATTKPRKKKHK